MKQKTPKEAADKFLQKVVRETAARLGSKKELASAMRKLTGQSVTRQMVERWLHPDPAKRKQPSFGYGLLLVEAWDSINNKGKKKK